MSVELAVLGTRADAVETVHRVSVAIVDGAGTLAGSSGDPDYRTFMRSAAKPFQAIPLAARGALEAFEISDEELALCTASHNSERYQVERVAGLLERIGCVESDLACGPHRPLFSTLASAKPGDREPEIAAPGRLASNCSGKHTGMLALCRHLGWPTRGYNAAGHELQLMLKEELALWSEVPEKQIGVGVDGCGVSTFHLPLAGMARAYARLAGRESDAARVIVHAMTTCPAFVAGTGRLCTEVMQLFPGKLVAKVGASGIYCGATVDPPMGIALKVEDGDNFAAGAAFLSVLDQLGIDPAPSEALPGHGRRKLMNTRGEEIGEYRVVGSVALK